VKLRGAVSRAFRLPTYTDLYYHDPANLGSPDLRPESAWSYEGGLDFHAGRRWRAAITVFHRRETDGIDYVRRSDRDIWRAANIHKLRFTGVETSLHAASRYGQWDLSYTGLRGVEPALGGVLSKYVFNYPSNSGIVGWLGTLPAGITVRSRLGVLKRYARDPYALWDVYVASTRSSLHPFVQVTNITNTHYQEIPGVVMPGTAFVAGIEWVLAAK
jgi:iron complex outermembrane receptor protein